MAPGKGGQLLTKTKQNSTNSEAKGVEEFCRAFLKDGFFSCLFFTLWSPVPPSSLSCDVFISSCVFIMMWQLERDLSILVYLFRMFSTRSTPIPSPG